MWNNPIDWYAIVCWSLYIIIQYYWNITELHTIIAYNIYYGDDYLWIVYKLT